MVDAAILHVAILAILLPTPIDLDLLCEIGSIYYEKDLLTPVVGCALPMLYSPHIYGGALILRGYAG